MLIKEAQGGVSMVLGVSNDIIKLKRRTESLNPFIPDAERRRVTDQRVQRWYSSYMNAMYDITDTLEICQIEADKRRESRIASLEQKLHSCFHSLLFFLYNPIFAHQIGRRIKKLNQRLDNIIKEAADFNFNTDISSYQDMRMLREAENSSRRSMSEFDESAIVGKNVENDMKLLVQELITYEDHDIKVVSIEGMGGIGKTTLAQKIFNHKAIQEHFKTRIWLGISRHFDETELLRSAIKHARRDHGNEQDMSILVRTLADALSTSKFLIVMDDMCSEEVWHNLLSVPIKNASRKQQGSRVMITTRFEEMALKMGTAFHRHRVSPLDAEDAWSLLKKQLTPNQEVGIDHLKNIGMEILKRCEGLPLAIKVVGGLLSTKYPSEGEWKTVLNSRAWSESGLPPQLDSRLYLSYGELSPELKQCFLYCSLIPKGADILQDVVARMWISEGCVHQSLDGNSTASSHDYELEDIAIGYYHDLRKRNLIETVRRYSLTGYRSTLHDVVRSFAEYVAREELMVVAVREQVATGGNGGEMLVRRLSIGHVISVAEWAALKRREALRTLIINSKINFQPGDSLDGFSSLRVLYICSANCNELVASLSGLKHLRYLHLEKTDISKLPDDIHKMKFLLFISLIQCEKLDHLPSSITELVQLRYLDIRGSNISAMPNGFGRLTNLRSLFGFQAHMDMIAGSSCLTKQLAPLSQLRDLTLENLGKVTASSMVQNDTISTKGHLGYLALNYSATGHTVGPYCDEAEQQQQQSVVEDVLEKLRPPNCIENLTVKGGYVGRQLPKWMQAPESAGFSSLRYITLEDLHCCTQLPDGLCCLLSLELLTILQAPAIKRIGNEFQASPPLAYGDSSATLAPFPRLKKLQLRGLCEWEEWEWNDPEEQGGVMKDILAMPCLELLHIKNCKLSCLPPGLANCNRQALRLLALYQVCNLASLENFHSVAMLDLFDCHELNRISGFSRLQKIRIVRCPNLQVLEGVPALDNVVVEDTTMETVPEYLITVNPRYLKLHGSRRLQESLTSPGSSEWMKISHIEIVKII